MSASEKIARLRELHAEHLKAAGPFKSPRNRRPLDHLRLAELDRDFVAAASVALPALLECAEALEAALRALDLYEVAHDQDAGTWGLATLNDAECLNVDAATKARLALQALAEGGGG